MIWIAKQKHNLQKPTHCAYISFLWVCFCHIILIQLQWNSKQACWTLKIHLWPKYPAWEASSFRPVSLLCPPIKFLERLILPIMTKHLPVPEFQHGFRKDHSTLTALNEFNDDITNDFNKKAPPDRTFTAGPVQGLWHGFSWRKI